MSVSILIPVSIPIYHFDGGNNGGRGEELQYYSRRKKQGVQE